MTKSETKRAKMLEKVRGLLAKADSTNFPEEAETFRAKADELMTAYAIEEWQVEKGKENTRPEPTRRDFDCAWYYRSPRGDELWQLFHKVARHCRCKMIWWKGGYTTPVIGLPADLDYLDALFTQLMLEMAKRIEPKPNESETVAENGYRLRSSGMNWMETTRRMYEAGMLKLPRGHVRVYFGKDDGRGGVRQEVPLVGGEPWKQLTEKTRQAMKNRLAQTVRNYRRAENLRDYTEVHPSVYQRSFAEGFVAEINSKLHALRREAERTDGDSSNEPGTALALRDIRKVVEDAAGEMFGAAPRGRSIGEAKTDAGAYLDGKAEAKKVNVSGSPQSGLRQAGRLPGS